MPAYPPDYYQAGFPVLSFLYALYTDAEFSGTEHATWLEQRNRVPPVDYRGYLAKYPQFPADAERAIAVDVPSNGANSTGFYFPTPKQAWVGIDEIFREITAQPPQPRPPGDPRTIAQLGAERPVLRILAVLFLNQPGDPTSSVAAAIDALGVDQGIKNTLTRLINQKPAQLSDAEKGAIGGALVDEFIAPPPEW
jgi:hypothetical protein